MKSIRMLSVGVCLLAVGAVVLGACAPAEEAAPPEEEEELRTHEFKFVQPLFPEGSLEQEACQYIMDKSADESDGRITWSYYGPELAGYTETEGMLMDGTMHFGLTSPTPIHDSRWNMIECPYMFETLADVKNLTGPPDGLLLKMGREWAPKNNWRLLGLMPQEWTGVSLTSGIVTSPEEAKGAKLRTPPSDARVCCWETLGFTPVTMDYSEVPSALATGIIEGQAGGGYWQAYDCCRDFQKYLVIYRDTFVPAIIVANRDAWNSLAAADQQMIQDAADYVCSRQPDAAVARSAEYKKILEEDFGWTTVDLYEDYPDQYQTNIEMVRDSCWPVMEELVGKQYVDQLREYYGLETD
jgi:TRAP-type C4-dicarboxylate transport system substrate-binding protein